MISLISPLMPVMMPVLLCASLGWLWLRFNQPFDQEFVRRLVMWVGAPALIVATLGRINMSPELLGTVLLAALVLLAVNAVFAVLFCRLAGFSLRDFLIPLVFGNFGNMGLPICLFASHALSGLKTPIHHFLMPTVTLSQLPRSPTRSRLD